MGLYEKIAPHKPDYIIADSGYKTPYVAKKILEDGTDPLFPYTRPKTKDGFFKKYEYAYDEQNDCYICPNDKILSYSTTNREGYSVYKSHKSDCENCPYLDKCTHAKNKVKVINRHVWQDKLDQVEDLRHTLGNKEIYSLRKQTIERAFAVAKEHHGYRYTNQNGLEKMKDKSAITFSVMNLKKFISLQKARERYAQNREKS